MIEGDDLMRIRPAIANARIDYQRDRQMGGIFHDITDDFDGFFGLVFRGFKDQFIVDLQQHPGFKARINQSTGNRDHRAFDDIGRTALNRGVDGSPFAKATAHAIFIVDAIDMDVAAKQGADMAMFFGKFLGLIHVIANAGVNFEIGFDEGLGFFLSNAELIGQTKGRYAIDDAKVNCLGLTAHHRVHAFNRDTKHL